MRAALLREPAGQQDTLYALVNAVTYVAQSLPDTAVTTSKSSPGNWLNAAYAPVPAV